MNQLKMDIQQTIGRLSRGGWSQRRIARELGIDRETVARYRRLMRQAEAPKPAIPPAGSEPGHIKGRGQNGLFEVRNHQPLKVSDSDLRQR